MFVVPAKAASETVLDIFDRTTSIVTQNFYDQTFRGLPWKELVASFRNKLSVHSSEQQLETTVNDLLAILKASHTEFLSKHDQEYWALKSIFSGEITGTNLNQIGAWFLQRDSRWFVQNVLQDSPAEKAGILSGDEILSVNGAAFSPVDSFISSPGQTVAVQIRHSPTSNAISVQIPLVNESLQAAFLMGSRASEKIFEINSRKIGYFHLWAGTHDNFKTALRDAATHFSKSTDAMILDLRDGFGGANPTFLDPFFDHDENGKPIAQIYSKPLVALINEGTRSGKEWVTYLLQKSHRATLVGTRTKGYFLAGKPFDIQADQFLLFLAVSGNGPEGVDLENNGVCPDIEVPMTVEYSHGEDVQLGTALKVIRSKL